MTQVRTCLTLHRNKLKQERWSEDQCQGARGVTCLAEVCAQCFSSSFHVICREAWRVGLINVTSVHSWCKILIFMSVFSDFVFSFFPLTFATDSIKPYLSINNSVLQFGFVSCPQTLQQCFVFLCRKDFIPSILFFKFKKWRTRVFLISGAGPKHLSSQNPWSSGRV